MKTFKSFLSDCGVEDIEELILFLNNLPDNPDDLVNIQDIGRFKKEIEKVFDEVI